jgi:hypothetical protein
MEVLPREAAVRMRSTIMMATLAVLLAACGGSTSTGREGGAPPVQQEQARCAFPAAAPEGVPWQERPGMYEPSMLPAAMDTHAGRIVVLQPRPTVVEVPVTWTFDVCRNSWQRMSATLAPDADVWQLVYHEEADLTLAIPGWEGPIRAYSYADDVWMDLPQSGAQPEVVRDAVYDPDTGSVIGWSDQTSTLWTYDIDRRAWAEELRRPGDRWPDLTSRTIDDWVGYTLMAYDTVRHAVLLAVFPVEGRNGSTWTFDVRSRRWTDLRTSPPAVPFGYGELGTEMAYDSAHGRAVATSGGDVVVFDSRSGAWSRPSPEEWGDAIKFDTTWAPWELGGQVVWPNGMPHGLLARTAHTLVYDPANERAVLLGGNARAIDPDLPVDVQMNWWLTADTWAYDVEGNAWTRLVPAQEPLVMAGTYRPSGHRPPR